MSPAGTAWPAFQPRRARIRFLPAPKPRCLAVLISLTFPTSFNRTEMKTWDRGVAGLRLGLGKVKHGLRASTSERPPQASSRGCSWSRGSGTRKPGRRKSSHIWPRFPLPSCCPQESPAGGAAVATVAILQGQSSIPRFQRTLWGEREKGGQGTGREREVFPVSRSVRRDWVTVTIFWCAKALFLLDFLDMQKTNATKGSLTIYLMGTGSDPDIVSLSKKKREINHVLFLSTVVKNLKYLQYACVLKP